MPGVLEDVLLNGGLEGDAVAVPVQEEDTLRWIGDDFELHYNGSEPHETSRSGKGANLGVAGSPTFGFGLGKIKFNITEPFPLNNLTTFRHWFNVPNPTTYNYTFSHSIKLNTTGPDAEGNLEPDACLTYRPRVGTQYVWTNQSTPDWVPIVHGPQTPYIWGDGTCSTNVLGDETGLGGGMPELPRVALQAHPKLRTAVVTEFFFQSIYDVWDAEVPPGDGWAGEPLLVDDFELLVAGVGTPEIGNPVQGLPVGYAAHFAFDPPLNVSESSDPLTTAIEEFRTNQSNWAVNVTVTLFDSLGEDKAFSENARLVLIEGAEIEPISNAFTTLIEATSVLADRGERPATRYAPTLVNGNVASFEVPGSDLIGTEKFAKTWQLRVESQDEQFLGGAIGGLLNNATSYYNRHTNDLVLDGAPFSVISDVGGLYPTNVNMTRAPVALRFDADPAALLLVNEPFDVAVKALNGAEQPLDGDIDDELTIELALAQGGATLAGETTATTQDGIATFVDLRVGSVGDFNLEASNQTWNLENESALFEVAYGDPDHLVISSEPSADIEAGAGFGITVEVRNAFDALVQTSTIRIELSIESGPPMGLLDGAAIADAVGGVATFNALWLNKTGSYTLQANASDPPEIPGDSTNAINVVPGPADDVKIFRQHNAAWILADEAFGLTIDDQMEFEARVYDEFDNQRLADVGDWSLTGDLDNQSAWPQQTSSFMFDPAGVGSGTVKFNMTNPVLANETGPITVTPGAPDTLLALENGTVRTVPATGSIELTAQLLDWAIPVRGKDIDFTLSNGAATIVEDPPTISSDGDGKAIVTVRAGSTVGAEFKVFAKYGNAPNQLEAEWDVEVVAPSGMQVAATGDLDFPGLEPGVDEVTFEVQVTNSTGTPLEGIQVSWLDTTTNADLTPADPLTNETGHANLTYTAHEGFDSTHTIQATVDDETVSPVTFTATTRDAYALVAVTNQELNGLEPGSTVTLEVRVQDADESGVDGQLVDWSVTSGRGTLDGTDPATTSDGGIASIDVILPDAASAVTTVTAAGSEYVPDSITFTLTTQGPASIVIEPAVLIAVPGLSFTFTDRYYDDDGVELSDPGGSWSVSGSASVTHAGEFSSTEVGDYTITVSFGDITGTAIVHVVEDPTSDVASLEYSPPEATVQATTQTRLVPKAFDADGVQVVGFSASYALSNSLQGIVNSNGVFDAHKTGTVTLTATANGHSADLSIGVVPGPLAKIKISPDGTVLDAGETVQFSATGFDARNNPVSSFTPSWTLVQANGGSLTSDGAFTSGPEDGNAVIRASSGAVNAEVVASTSTVTVETGETATIEAQTTARQVGENQATGYRVGVKEAKNGALLEITSSASTSNSSALKSARATIGADATKLSVNVETQGGSRDAVPDEVDSLDLLTFLNGQDPSWNPAVFLTVSASEDGANMESDRLNQVIEEMRVEFRVNSTFFDSGDLDPSLLELLEYSDGQRVEGAIALTLESTNAPDGFYNYTATLNSFSSFAVIPRIGGGGGGGGGGECRDLSYTQNVPFSRVSAVTVQFSEFTCRYPRPVEVETTAASQLPQGVSAPPRGIQVLSYVRVSNINAQGRISEIDFSIHFAPDDAPTSNRGVLLIHGANGWVPAGDFQLSQTALGAHIGVGTSQRCCGVYLVGFDLEPMVLEPVTLPSLVTGTVALRASATDNLPVRSVQFFVDGVLVRTDTEAPYEHAFDSRVLENGDHAFRYTATSASGEELSMQESRRVFNSDVIGGGPKEETNVTPLSGVAFPWIHLFGLVAVVGLYVGGSYGTAKAVRLGRQRGSARLVDESGVTIQQAPAPAAVRPVQATAEPVAATALVRSRPRYIDARARAPAPKKASAKAKPVVRKKAAPKRKAPVRKKTTSRKSTKRTSSKKKRGGRKA